jgi:tripartite-type tricarboxylate transporter receptor subunit TctC
MADMQWLVRLIIVGFAFVLAGAGAARCADESNFYVGKSLTVIAGYPPGGGVDGEMRVLTRYFARHIPGAPTIISRNMPGAGGIVLGNSLYNVTAPDGLTLGMPGRSGFLLTNVVPQKGISYDLTKFSYVGAAGSAINCLWLNRRTGISSLADLMAAKKEIVIGAINPRSENAIAPRALAKYLGWPLKIVTGYGGFNEVLIAMERGEVDGLFTHEGSILNTRPDLIASGAVKAIVQAYDGMPDVPVLSDVVTDPKAKALLNLVTTPSTIGLPLMGPPGIPASRLELLRKSYMELMADEEYRAEAEKRGQPVGRAVDGAKLQQLIVERLSSVPDSVVKEYMAFAGIKAEE